MSMHTPGPWIVDEDDRPGMAWNRHVVSAADPNIAICFMAHSDGRDPARDASNARLVAAAPALLKALRKLDSIERGMQGWHEDAKAEAWADARAALAMAQGGGE